ncbi:DUF1176 domain-containing protein [Massilia sp. Leaf139]|uniref:DUF1176 domain-containing protein n=1 Tax=Massilia sp. Leaf139 TaxID=1736272 RepID=UPI0006F88F44|nr:DUF1176 domain-containing protein [Massilia sp. Leaf139]KQQ86583.1 hypothetical protein ASF77_19980 [Massilia sp. Leaf139]
MNPDPILLGFLLLLAGLPLGNAAQAASLSFSHYDWEIACDNTRTCRAAGYHSESGERLEEDGESEQLPVSVLLTRKAGPREPVQAEFQIGNPGEGETFDGWPATMTLTLRIDGKPVDKTVIRQGKWTTRLGSQPTALLLAALLKQSSIAWSDGKRTWRLSDKGAAAVLLKMDEFQGRLGTPGALTRKGKEDENSVLPPLPAPVVQAAPVPADDRVQLPRATLNSLRSALRASTKDCEKPEPGESQPELHVRRLSATKLLASMPCWAGAYNTGEAYWVVNAKPPYAPELLTLDATDYSAGKLDASQKGRGIGDCWSFDERVWTGQRFVQTSQGTTGKCMNIAAGGAWSLPLLVTTVRPAPGTRP